MENAQCHPPAHLVVGHLRPRRADHASGVLRRLEKPFHDRRLVVVDRRGVGLEPDVHLHPARDGIAERVAPRYYRRVVTMRDEQTGYTCAPPAVSVRVPALDRRG